MKRLSVLHGADRKIGYVVLLNRLDYGLEQSAIRAARSIQFEPRCVDGKPVDTVATIEYTFYTY